MSQSYPALRILASVLVVLGYLSMIGGVLASVLILSAAFSQNEPTYAGAPIIFITFFGAVLVGIPMVAFGELIRLLIDIEASTRAMATGTLAANA
jgi:hypothetical protein